MAITFPTHKEIIDRTRAEIATEIPDTDPTIDGSFLRGIADSLSNRNFDVVQLLEQLLKEMFPQTATGEFLERFAAYENLTRNAAISATGEVTFLGTDGTLVVTSTQIKSVSTGKIYSTNSNLTLGTNDIFIKNINRSGTTVSVQTASDHDLATGQQLTIGGTNETGYGGTYSIIVTGNDTFTYEITSTPATPGSGTVDNPLSVSGLTRVATTVTVVTTVDHNVLAGEKVTMAGAIEPEYNGTFTITNIVSSTSFDYEIVGSPSTPATGTLTASFSLISFDGGTVNITSDDTGEINNLDSGAQLTLIAPITGVDSVSYVRFAGIVGGLDSELDEDLLKRILAKRANPVANFNIAAIEIQAFLISGVTRVKVKRITPAVGQVTILFVMDAKTDITLDEGEVATVKAKIVEILPATSDEADVIVATPTAVTSDFTFSFISPDTATMRAAIIANLAAFYINEVTFDTTIDEDGYKTAIKNTIDPETGDVLNQFTLTSPSGDIVIVDGEIGVLGTVVFS